MLFELIHKRTMSQKIFPTKITKWNILLVAIIVVSAVINLIWIIKNKTAPSGNGLTDLFPAINFYLDVAQGNTPVHRLFAAPVSIVNLEHFFKTLGEYIRYSFFIYPPLAPLSYSLTYFIFGLNSHLELTVNIVYFSLALWALYNIGKIILDERAGILAVFVFSTFPGVIVKTRQVYSEFIVMCLIPLVFLFLLRTDLFRNRKYSILFGLSLGIIALAKWEFLLAFLAPFVLYLSYSILFLRNNDIRSPETRTLFVNLTTSLLLAGVVSLTWYGVGFQDAYWRVFCNDADKVLLSTQDVSVTPDWFIYKISHYSIELANGLMHFFYFCLFILSTLFIIRNFFYRESVLFKKSQFPFIFFIAIWILVPYTVLSFMKAQHSSHILIILPAAALVISLGVLSCRNSYLQRFFISLMLVYGVCAYAQSFVPIKPFDSVNIIRLKVTPKRDQGLELANYNPIKPFDYVNIIRLRVPPKWNLGLELANDDPNFLFAFEGRRLYKPDERSWRYEEIISFIQHDSRTLGRKPLVYFLGLPFEEFSVFTLQYYNLLTGFTLFIEPRGNDKSESPPDRSKFDYAAILSNKKISEQNLEELLATSYNVDPKNHKTDLFKNEFFYKFSLIQEFLLPNGAKIYVYKRNTT